MTVIGVILIIIGASYTVNGYSVGVTWKNNPGLAEAVKGHYGFILDTPQKELVAGIVLLVIGILLIYNNSKKKKIEKEKIKIEKEKIKKEAKEKEKSAIESKIINKYYKDIDNLINDKCYDKTTKQFDWDLYRREHDYLYGILLKYPQLKKFLENEIKDIGHAQISHINYYVLLPSIRSGDYHWAISELKKMDNIIYNINIACMGGNYERECPSDIASYYSTLLELRLIITRNPYDPMLPKFVQKVFELGESVIKSN